MAELTGRGIYDNKETTDLVGVLLGLLGLVLEVSNDPTSAEHFALQLKEGLENTVNVSNDEFKYNIQQMYFEFFIGMGWDPNYLLTMI